MVEMMMVRKYALCDSFSDVPLSQACPPVVMFQRRPVLSMPDFVTTFSVKSFLSSTLKGRAIVSHTGTSASSGVWRCTKDSGTNACPHVTSAQKVLEDMLGPGNNKVDPNISFDAIPS
jgi:hypothetical protein